MIKEYDIVKTVKDLSDKVRVGTEGTVLMIYPDYPTVYEIEFVNEMKESLEMLTVQADNVVKVNSMT